MSVHAASSSPPIPFGALLRRQRIAAGLTQEELAERASISVRRIGDLERGVRQLPRRDTVVLPAAALGLSPQEQAVFMEAARRVEAATPVPVLPPHTGAPTPPFVGRTGELALLERHLAGQGPPLLLFAGEPGIGKSRLLHAAVPRAMAQGCRVLEGGCQRRGGHEPYAPLLGALQQYLRGRQPAQLRADLRGCAWLVRLLPELAAGPIEPLPAWTVPPEQEHRLMVAAVQRFLANVAGSAGTLLVLDDLQWAGPDALDLLVTLVRAASDVPLRVVGAYRDTEVQPLDPLSHVLADLAHARLAARRRLAPLGRKEAARLLDELLADRAATDGTPRDRILQRAGGVPFFLVSFAQEPQTGELADQEPGMDGGRETAPWDVAHSIRQRLAALPEGAGEVMGAAAVIGRVVEPMLLTTVLAAPEREVLRALDAASRAGLLVAEQAAMQFAHDVIREVAEADLGPARRVALHRRVAEALEGQSGEPPLELLAYHYNRAGVQDRAARYLEQAGDRARMRYAYAAAQGFYTACVEGWDRLGQALEAARVRAKAGATLSNMGRYEAAQRLLEQAAEVYMANGAYAPLATLVAEIGRHYYYQYRFHEGLRWLEPRVAALEAVTTPPLPPEALAPLYQALCALYRSVGRHSESLAMGARSIELLRRVDAGSAIATALYRYCCSLVTIVGRVEEMRQAAMEAERLAETVGDLNVLQWALHLLAYTYQIKGEWDRCLSYADRAIDAAERRGDPGPLEALIPARGMAAFYRGDWLEARRFFERARAISHRIGVSYPDGDSPTRLPFARLALVEGAWDRATEAAEEALALAQESGQIDEQQEAHALLAELELRRGRAREARERLAPLRDHPGVEERGITPLLVLLAWAHLELDEIEAAQGVIATAARRLRADDDRLGLVDALRVQAMVLSRCGLHGEAVASLEEGLALARAMPHPYAEARLLHLYGQLLAKRQEPAPARERLEAALAIFQRLGARGDVRRVEQDLRKLAGPPRPHPVQRSQDLPAPPGLERHAGHARPRCPAPPGRAH
jgi:tetratricopeptide (TPR) repeat protein/transcriptional regulator with XRE-family HTH domain